MHEPLPERTEAAARAAVQAAIRVHRELGPGLLESVYEHCLSYELSRMEVPAQRQLALPIRYGGVELEAGYRLDLVVDDSVIIEIKSIEALAPIHDAQVLTYLKLSGLRLGLLINFNVPFLKQGLRRLIL
jgi:GxxExxY protein